MAPKARQREVLDVARDAFHQYGYERTATRDIANRLGILGGSLYYYVDSKETLLFEVLEEVQAPGMAAVQEIRAAPGSGRARLESLIGTHVSALAADPTGISLLFSERQWLGPARRRLIENGLRDYRRGFQKLIADGQADGSLSRDRDPKLATLVALGPLNWIYRWYRNGGLLSPERLTTCLTRILLEGVARPAVLGDREPGPAASPPEDRRRPRRDRRAELLDAAAALFSERGYERTTTQDIAERVGLRKPSLYHYVHSKEELLLTLMRTVHEESMHMLQKGQLDGADPFGRLRCTLERHVGYTVRNAHRAGVFLHQARSLPAAHRGEIRRWERQYADALAGLLAEAQCRGVVREDVSPAVMARILLGALNAPQRWFQAGSRWSLEDVQAETATVLLGGIGSLDRARDVPDSYD